MQKYSSNQDTTLEELSPTAQETKTLRLATLQQKTDPVFKKYAPIVFEKLVQEGGQNTEWQEREEQRAKEILSDSQFDGTHLEEVRCAADLCRVTVTNRDAESISRFIRGTIGSSRGWNTEVYFNVKNTSDDSAKCNIYFSKQSGDIDFHIRARQELLSFI